MDNVLDFVLDFCVGFLCWILCWRKIWIMCWYPQVYNYSCVKITMGTWPTRGIHSLNLIISYTKRIIPNWFVALVSPLSQSYNMNKFLKQFTNTCKPLIIPASSIDQLTKQ